MKNVRSWMVMGLAALVAVGCNKESSAETKDSKATGAAAPEAKCKDGDVQHQEMGFCLTAPGAVANPVATFQGPGGPTRSTTVAVPNQRGVEIKRYKGTLENEVIGLDNVSKFEGNKEIERGKLPGDKGVFVVADEEGCCVRITAVLPVGEEVLTCMATADRGAPQTHFDGCKSLRAL